jgi:hypothetical protein
MKDSLSKQIQNIVKYMERVSSRVLSRVPDFTTFKEVQETFDTPTIADAGLLSTQFYIGKNYWLPVHQDDDYFHTILSCYSEETKNHDDIIYNFVFPEYKCYVPLQQGDILVFNPWVKHCCTNQLVPDRFLFSAYVSKDYTGSCRVLNISI